MADRRIEGRIDSLAGVLLEGTYAVAPTCVKWPCFMMILGTQLSRPAGGIKSICGVHLPLNNRSLRKRCDPKLSDCMLDVKSRMHFFR